MTSPISRAVILAVGLLGASAVSVNAKPPDTPTGPNAVLKVLPSYSQEHFQAEVPNKEETFVPSPFAWTVKPDLPVAGAVIGSGLAIALFGDPTTTRADSLIGGCGAFSSRAKCTGLEVVRVVK